MKLATPEAGAAREELESSLEEIEVLWEELRTQAEHLARERQRYAEFFEYAPEAYLFTDAAGAIREANRAAAELFGVSQGAAPRRYQRAQGIAISVRSTARPVSRACQAMVGAAWRTSKARDTQPASGERLPL
jgi:PAS domain-containing protein